MLAVAIAIRAQQLRVMSRVKCEMRRLCAYSQCQLAFTFLLVSVLGAHFLEFTVLAAHVRALLLPLLRSLHLLYSTATTSLAALVFIIPTASTLNAARIRIRTALFAACQEAQPLAAVRGWRGGELFGLALWRGARCMPRPKMQIACNQ